MVTGTKTRPYFHSHDGICFRRLDAGEVQIFTKCTTNDDEREFEVFDRNSWASIVASVSEKGEHDGRFYEALRFHREPDGANPKMLSRTPSEDDVERVAPHHIEALHFRMTRLEEMGDEVADMTPGQAEAEYRALEAAIAALEGGSRP